jgi:hypothetical protein
MPPIDLEPLPGLTPCLKIAARARIATLKNLIARSLAWIEANKD